VITLKDAKVKIQAGPKLTGKSALAGAGAKITSGHPHRPQPDLNRHQARHPPKSKSPAPPTASPPTRSPGRSPSPHQKQNRNTPPADAPLREHPATVQAAVAG
jgi:hypothetical protein